jgi:hypothetical protein
MATGKVARRTAVEDVRAILDSPEVLALIGELTPKGRGRKGFGPRVLIGACLVKALFALPTLTRVAALIAEHPGLQDALGGAPSCWACYRFTVKLRENQPAVADCLDAILEALHAETPGMGEDVAIDASDLPAFANGQRFVYQGGPERKRYSDPDASWGHRSAVSTRAAGSFYGYKLNLAACVRTGLPLAWRVESARRHESTCVAPLLDALHTKGFRPQTCAADKGYDHARVHAECETRGVGHRRLKRKRRPHSGGRRQPRRGHPKGPSRSSALSSKAGRYALGRMLSTRFAGLLRKSSPLQDLLGWCRPLRSLR